MTIQQGWTEDESGQNDYETEGNEEIGANFPVVPVRIVFDENQRLAPSFCSHMTWQIAQTGQGVPTQILPRQERRFKAKFLVNFTAAGTLYLNNRQGPLGNPTPQGSELVAAVVGNFTLPDYDAMQPMYAIASVAGVTVSVWDEAFGAVSA